MKPTTLWQVMTPTTQLGDRMFVPWRVAADHRFEAERMAEQAALALGLVFVGDLRLDRVGKVYVEGE